MLRAFEGEWLRYPVLKRGCIVLSSMNMYLATDSFVSLLYESGCGDFQIRKIKDDMNILDVTATCELREDLIDETEYCPLCGNSLSITFSKGFHGNKTRILKSINDKTAMLCRSRYPVRDSGRATHQLFARNDLAEILRKTKCFDMYGCMDVEENQSETSLPRN